MGTFVLQTDNVIICTHVKTEVLFNQLSVKLSLKQSNSEIKNYKEHSILKTLMSSLMEGLSIFAL